MDPNLIHLLLALGIQHKHESHIMMPEVSHKANIFNPQLWGLEGITVLEQMILWKEQSFHLYRKFEALECCEILTASDQV